MYPSASLEAKATAVAGSGVLIEAIGVHFLLCFLSASLHTLTWKNNSDIGTEDESQHKQFYPVMLLQRHHPLLPKHSPR